MALCAAACLPSVASDVETKVEALLEMAARVSTGGLRRALFTFTGFADIENFAGFGRMPSNMELPAPGYKGSMRVGAPGLPVQPARRASSGSSSLSW